MIKKQDLIALAVVAIMVVLYGIFDGIKDTLAHHYSISIFKQGSLFWDASISWCNKWENCESGKERFLGSSSWLVWTTDGWHLMKFLQNRLWLFFPALFLTVSFHFESRFWNFTLVKFLLFYVFLAVVQSVGFTMMYDWLLLR